MKRLILNTISLIAVIIIFGGCDKTGNFPGAEVNPNIAIYDLRSFYKGTDYPLTKKSMLGSVGITGVVVSDHSGKNLPAGLLMVQNKVRLNALRGIAINIGAAAGQFVPGDSVIVHLEGGVLTRIDGLLQVTGLDASAVTRVASGVNIPVNRVPSSYILAEPDKYESTELVIVKAGFDPLPQPTDTYSGDKMVNDGFASLTVHTEPGATFANNSLPGMANFFGVIAYSKDGNGKYVPHLRIRRPEDITVLSSTITQAAIVISGYIGDVKGTDLDGEYMQFLATKDIDFSVTPYSVVTHNTSSGYSPTGVPVNGWATGGKRDYKFDLKSGTVKKGEYFYVGNSAKLINGVGSTSIAQGKWIVSRKTNTTAGDGIGDASSDLFLNATSAFTDGIAVFEGTTVTKNSVPIDVIITGYNGAILNVAQGAGLRIANTDWYDIVNPVTLEEQPFYKQGSNTLYITRKGEGYFYKLGGQYNTRLGRWVQARFDRALLLSTTSTLDELEKEYPVANGSTDGWFPTKLVE
ncbi:hypothetical protein FW774_12780 [Pedobacter sp. BS3]|uniref:DUF5689 domain-containing protein n=1 Tax=Pedobacter sp. BS3 TaxID=2567937 RepID=UPI0011EC5867|nr:DUF5689 domain-containing protein [Pedobacter sp. BS3]TZF83165.1 hypothetical protein FW774_12780 [Pedobacter sp. BS3]